jgi:hypothetical protein
MSLLTTQTFELLAGVIFLFVAVIGGGITAKEVTIPSVPMWGRCAAAVVGLAFIGLGVFFPEFHPGIASNPTQACRNSKNLPNIVSVVRSEADARNFLTSAGFFNVVTEPAFVAGAPTGVVVGQSPTPGTVLCPRDQITLKISS